jgi:hypothetical protein
MNLSERWRKDAELLRRHGALEAAMTKETCADELDAYSREHHLEALTLTQAAAESGYSAGHIARLLETGRLPQAGEKYAPRVRRKDLPLKAKKPATTSEVK